MWLFVFMCVGVCIWMVCVHLWVALGVWVREFVGVCACVGL